MRRDPDRSSPRTLPPVSNPRPVLVVDFGAQYAQLIARRVREARVFSEIVPSTMPVAEMLARDPAAVILSGGPSSVYAPGAPSIDAALFDAGVPVFGICYGFQAMARALGGEVAQTGLSEFGRTPLEVAEPGALFAGLPDRAVGLDVARRLGVRGARRVHGHRVQRRGADRRLREPHHPLRRCAVPPRGAAHRARPGDPRALPARPGRAGPGLDHGVDRRRAGGRDPRPGRRPPGDLRALRRGRLGRRGGAGARGGRRPAHLRLRRPRPAAQGRARAGRARLRGRHRHPSGRRRCRRAVPVGARRRDRPGGEAQDDRPAVHPGVRGRRRPGRGRTGRARRNRGLPRAGHALPGRRGVRRRHRHGQHQEPPQRRRPARRPPVPARRAAADAVQGRGAPRR